MIGVEADVKRPSAIRQAHGPEQSRRAALPSSLVPPGRRPSGPEALRRTSVYASFLGISEALHMDIFHQPLRSSFFESLNRRM
jgi:hypothetical protein